MVGYGIGEGGVFMLRPAPLVLAICLFPALAFAQAKLENPASGSTQSGIGLISGWKCTGSNISAQVDGVFLSVPYGSQRGDTQSICGDVNNGFGLLVNWNLLPNGTHTLILLDNGAEFARVTFTTQSLGQQFLTGASRSVTVNDFPNSGQSTTLRWQESLQNFIVSGLSSGGGGGSNDLKDLLGTWEFVTTIGSSTFRDHYRLQRIEIANNGKPAIVGTDLDQGDTIVAARVQDLISQPFPYDFALLDPGSLICDLFVFNKTGANTVTGADVLFASSGTSCSTTPTTGIQHPMIGTRTSLATLQEEEGEEIPLQPAPLLEAREQLKIMEDSGRLQLGQRDTGDTVPLEAIQEILSTLNQAID